MYTSAADNAFHGELGVERVESVPETHGFNR